MSLSPNGQLLLSISRAGRFKKCQRSFFYRYVANLADSQTRESGLGDLFHSVLDHWAELYMQKIDIRSAMKSAYTIAIQEREVDKTKVQLIKEELDQVKQWIKAYTLVLEQTPPNVLGHEKTFDFLIDKKFLVRGAIDRIDLVDKDTIRIVDYKVGNPKYVDNKQVAVYAKALIENPTYKNKRFIGGYIFLKENCRVVEYEITDKLMDSAVQYLREIGERIIIEKAWKPSFSPLCGWCSHKFQCATDNNQTGEVTCP